MQILSDIKEKWFWKDTKITRQNEGRSYIFQVYDSKIPSGHFRDFQYD